MIESRPVCPRNQLAPGTVGGWTRHVRGKLRAHPLLEFQAGENAASLGLTGKETFHVEGVKASLNGGGRKAAVRAVSDDGTEKTFTAVVRVDTPQEVEYYRNGGILPYVLRQLAAK